MKKLKLNKFKIASLSNTKKIKGGTDVDTGLDTERKVCINESKIWVVVGKDSVPVIIEQDNLINSI